ncbi:LPXTG cell wall anchor domain-containing protein [Ligilactobacillus sp. LYQ112]|uniref:LPXTG cell wall anchor domain-containing protein n=1 Tax=Ligilactobacillus sp. LYQ112 TaxID=3391060 RepID=UPI00398336A4
MQTQIWHQTLVSFAVLVTMISGGTVLATSNNMPASTRAVSISPVTQPRLERSSNIPLSDSFGDTFKLSNVLDNVTTPSVPVTLYEPTTPSLDSKSNPSTEVNEINTEQGTSSSVAASADSDTTMSTSSSTPTSASSIQYISSAATPSFDFTTISSASQVANNAVDISGLTTTKGKHHDKGDHLSSVKVTSTSSSSKKMQENKHHLPATGNQIVPWLIIPGLLSLIGAGALLNNRWHS